MSTKSQQLLQRIAGCKAVIGINGLVYLGLPLAMQLDGTGFMVVRDDVSARVVVRLYTSESHIQDVPVATVAAPVASSRLRTSTDEAVQGGKDAVSNAVSMRLVNTRDPDMSNMICT